MDNLTFILRMLNSIILLQYNGMKLENYNYVFFFFIDRCTGRRKGRIIFKMHTTKQNIESKDLYEYIYHLTFPAEKYYSSELKT